MIFFRINYSFLVNEISKFLKWFSNDIFWAQRYFICLSLIRKHFHGNYILLHEYSLRWVQWAGQSKTAPSEKLFTNLSFLKNSWAKSEVKVVFNCELPSFESKYITQGLRVVFWWAWSGMADAKSGFPSGMYFL